MARRKRMSEAVGRAKVRADGLASIDQNLDLGNGLTLVAFKTAIDDAEKRNGQYNEKLSEVDALLNQAETKEGELDSLTSRMLAAVGVKYGKDSDEYEKAGGTRTSDRKRPVRKTAALAPAT